MILYKSHKTFILLKIEYENLLYIYFHYYYHVYHYQYKALFCNCHGYISIKRYYCFHDIGIV